LLAGGLLLDDELLENGEVLALLVVEVVLVNGEELELAAKLDV
jgi:hypothetical protein